jgi:hypothetical protein
MTVLHHSGRGPGRGGTLAVSTRLLTFSNGSANDDHSQQSLNICCLN